MKKSKTANVYSFIGMIGLILLISYSSEAQHTAELIQGTSAPRLTLRTTDYNSNNPSGIVGLATVANNFCPGSSVGDLVISNNNNKSIVFGLGPFGDFSSPSNTYLERMRLTQDGKLGIGISAPTAMLHVKYPNTNISTRQKFQHWEWVSNSNFQLDFFGDAHAGRPGMVQFGGWNNDVALGFVVDSKTSVEDGTSVKGLFIRTSGTGIVGIGTATPASYLDVVAPNESAVKIQNTSTTNGSKVGIDFYAGGLSSPVAKAKIEAVDIPVSGASVGNAALAFSTRSNSGGNALERMRITPDGKVGIGHGWVFGSTPLDIEASLHVISPDNNNTFKIQNFRGVTNSSSVGVDFLTYAATATASKNARIEAVANTIDNGTYAKTDLAFLVNSDGSVNTTNLSEKMRIMSNGNIGVGTVAPEALFHVRGNDSPAIMVSQPNTTQGAADYRGALAVANCGTCHTLDATVGDVVLRAVNSGKNLIITNNGGDNGNSGSILLKTGSAAGWYEKTRMEITKTGNIDMKGRVQVTLPGGQNPDAGQLGLTFGEAAGVTHYTWIQSNEGKPLALIPMAENNANYVSIGYIPGTYTVPSGYKLAVKGNILCEEMKVKYAHKWPDFVFDNTYKLRTLNEVESYIKENKHLPDVPSAEEVAVNGIDTGKMDATLLKKIEELTLYMIEQQKQLEVQQKEIEVLKTQVKR